MKQTMVGHQRCFLSEHLGPDLLTGGGTMPQCWPSARHAENLRAVPGISSKDQIAGETMKSCCLSE